MEEYREAAVTTASFWITTVSLILLPAIPLGAGWPSLRLDDIVPLGWMLLALLGLVSTHLGPIGRRRLLFLGLLALLIPFSILYGISAGYDGSPADFIQLFRVAKFAAVYALAAAYFSQLPDAEPALRRITLLGVVLFGIAVAQYFDLFGLNRLYVPIIAPTQFHSLLNDYPHPRPVGMMGNPNELGFLFVLLAVAACHRFSTTERSGALLLIGVFAAGVLMTLSRGATAALVVVGAIYAVKSLFPTTLLQLLSKLLLAAALLIPFYVVLFHTPIYDVITWRFVWTTAMAPEGSWAQRLANWQENVGIVRKEFPFGVGPLRRVLFEHSADNEWLLMLRSYGVLGTAALVGLLIVPTFMLRDRRAMTTALSLAFATFVYMVPAAAFHSLSLFSLLLVLLAAMDTAKPGTSYARGNEIAPRWNGQNGGAYWLTPLPGETAARSVLRRGVLLAIVGVASLAVAGLWPRARANWPEHSIPQAYLALAKRTAEDHKQNLHPDEEARSYSAAGPYMGYGKTRYFRTYGNLIVDDEGFPKVKRGDFAYHDPAIIAQQALAEYSRKRGPTPMFLKATRKLMSMQDNRGALLYLSRPQTIIRQHTSPGGSPPRRRGWR